MNKILRGIKETKTALGNNKMGKMENKTSRNNRTNRIRDRMIPDKKADKAGINKTKKSTAGMNKTEKFNNGDFLEIEYTGILKEDNRIVDTTNAETAKKAGIYSNDAKYGPRIICLGEGQILKGIEEAIKSGGVGKYNAELAPENGFGRKNPKLLQLVSLSAFKKQNINPYPGLPVNLDNLFGTVRTVSGGRVIVDFNHPLSGRELVYELNVIGQITYPKEKISSLLNSFISKPEFSFENNELEIKNKLSKNMADFLREKITKLVKGVKNIKTSTQE